MLSHCVRWLVFSACASLTHMWVAWLIALWLSVPAVEKAILDGTLFVFATIRVASAFGTDYHLIARGYKDWPPLLAVIFGSIIGLASVVFYTMTALSRLVPPVPADPKLVKLLSITVAIAAVAYGLSCNVLSQHALSKERRQAQLKLVPLGETP